MEGDSNHNAFSQRENLKYHRQLAALLNRLLRGLTWGEE
jgi:hypothetical protein